MVTVFEPAEFVAVKFTLYVPTVLYTWVGFCEVDVLPSPKFHNQDVGELIEVSKNDTLNPAMPLVDPRALKLATGAIVGFTVMFIVIVLDPKAFEAFSVTVYVFAALYV